MRRSHGTRRPARLLALLTTIAMLAAMVPAYIAPVGAAAVAAGGHVWYVDASASTVGTGTEADPFRSISSALDAAAPGDLIEVGPGVYGEYEQLPLLIDQTLVIYSTDGSASTIIDADGASSSVIDVYGVGLDLEGFTITGGAFAEIGPNAIAPGGGINIINSYALLEDLVVTGNVGIEGAGIFIANSGVEIYDSVITANGEFSDEPIGMGSLSAPVGEMSAADIEAAIGLGYGTLFGGGISANSSEVLLQDCEISDNLANIAGGGISAWGSYMEFWECSVTGNALNPDMYLEPLSATSWDSAEVALEDMGDQPDGGGVFGYQSGLFFWGSEFAANQAVQYGAIASEVGYLYMEDCDISDHESFATVGVTGGEMSIGSSSVDDGYDSGHEPKEPSLRGIASGDVTAEAQDLSAAGMTGADVFTTKFTGNTCETVLWQDGSYLWMENDLFVDNTVYYPTVAVADCVASINFTTMANNGSEWSVWSQFSSTAVWGSILWDGNIEEPDMEPEALSPAVLWSGSLEILFSDLISEPQHMFDGSAPFTLEVISQEPRFMDEANGDYRLTLGSPCVDGVPDGPDRDYDYNERPVDADGDGGAFWDMGAYEYVSGGRFGGIDRYMTAIQLVEQNFATADTVVIATGEKFPDGLAASPLCGLYDAPLMLTPKKYLHPAIADEIERLGAENVIIVGSTAAVSAAVETSLKNLGLNVSRIGGANRYETAALIAAHVISHTDFDGRVIIARGDQFADALSVSPVAYANLIPVLLVNPDRLPMSTVEVLYNYGVTSAAVLGDSAAVDTRVEAGIQLSLGVATERIGGANRYETSALISQWAYDSGLADFNTVGLATGTKFPDALSGGPGIGTRNGVLLLTDPYNLSQPAGDALGDHAPEIEGVQYFGSVVAISDNVCDQVNGIIWGGPPLP